MTLKAAVIGHPVAHSKSPLIHQNWMAQYNIQGTYEAVNIAPERLEQGIKDLVSQGFGGFNATIPHKQALINLCDDLDDSAKKIGAVNTVKIENGKLTGYNTDAFGFIENLRHVIPDFDFQEADAFILGAGGAARAAIYGLREAGVKKITVCNRTSENAYVIAKEFECGVADWNDRRVLNSVTLLVNTTALGMMGKEPLQIDLALLPATSAVYDIVYAPLMTDLLQQAQARGNKIVTGIGMLLHQARPAFELWTGILPEVTPDLVQKVLA